MFSLFEDPRPLYLALALINLTSSIALFIISRRLGVPRPWLALIPLVNLYQFTRCSGENLLFIPLLLIPCLNVPVIIFLWWQIGERLGKYGFLSVLIVVPIAGWFVPLYYAFSE